MSTKALARARKLVALAATSPNEHEARNAGVEACKLIHRLGLLGEEAKPPEVQVPPPPAPAPSRRRSYRSRREPNLEDLKRREAAGEIRVAGPGARHIRPKGDPIDRLVDNLADGVGEFAETVVGNMLGDLFKKKGGW